MRYVPVFRVQLVREGSVNHEIVGKTIASSTNAKELFSAYFKDECQEVFSIMMLDTKNHILGVVTVTRGTLDASLVHPREVFKPAIAAGTCAAIICGHNHPSGDPTPSREDRSVTTRLEAAGEILGIDVLDHIIVGQSPDGTMSAVSLKEC